MNKLDRFPKLKFLPLKLLIGLGFYSLDRWSIYLIISAMKTLICGAVLLGLGLAPFAVHSVSVDAQTPKTSPAVSAPVEEFNVIGTEPFWNVTIGRRGIVYSTPDGKPQTFPYVAPMQAQGRPLDVVRVYRLQGQNNLLVLNKAACSDGMSDRQYAYSATLVMGNTVKTGCAMKK